MGSTYHFHTRCYSARKYFMHNQTQSRDQAARLLPRIERKQKRLLSEIQELTYQIESNLSQIKWRMDGCPKNESMSYYESVMEGHIGRE